MGQYNYIYHSMSLVSTAPKTNGMGEISRYKTINTFFKHMRVCCEISHPLPLWFCKKKTYFEMYFLCRLYSSSQAISIFKYFTRSSRETLSETLKAKNIGNFPPTP